MLNEFELFTQVQVFTPETVSVAELPLQIIGEFTKRLGALPIDMEAEAVAVHPCIEVAVTL